MNVQNPSASRGIVIQAVDLVKNYGTGSIWFTPCAA